MCIKGFVRAAALAAFLAVSLYGASANAVPGNVIWEAVYSSGPDNESDHAGGIAVDGQGNTAVTGYVTKKDGNYDYLTIKYGPEGPTSWVRIFDHSWYDVGRAVAFDIAGNVTVAGASNNLGNPRDTWSKTYYTDYRVVKYDPYGEVLTETTASGNGKNNEPAAMGVDNDGGIYVTGSARNTPDTYPEYYTVKFDPAGPVLWEKAEDWQTEAYATGLRLDKEGNVVVTGYYRDIANNNYNIRALRYTPDGKETLMDVTYGNFYEDEKAWGLAVDHEGSIIVTGETSAEGGVTMTLKYGPGGELLWAARYTRSEFKNRGNAVAADRDGRIYVVGRTIRPAGPEYQAGRTYPYSQPPSLTPDFAGDFLLLVYDKDGRLIDDRTYQFGGDSTAEDVALDPDGNIMITGTTRLPGQTAVFRTIRVEGYRAAEKPALEPGRVFKADERIALHKPALPMLRKRELYEAKQRLDFKPED